MAKLQQILFEQKNLFMEAKKRLENARNDPPPFDTTVAVREMTLTNLKTRVANLAKAKNEAAQRFDGQIAIYQKDIARLENTIEKDKENLELKKKASRAKKKK